MSLDLARGTQGDNVNNQCDHMSGELIAIITVFCWTISVQFFGSASKLIGATSVSFIRIILAMVLFSVFMLITTGEIVPLSLPISAWGYLMLSGAIGLFIGDIFLFKALVEIGPRLAMLIHSLAAPLAALIGFAILNESYTAIQWCGMFVTLSGVSLVILEKTPATHRNSRLNVQRISLAGILYGIGAMFGQAGGYILSKKGMQFEDGFLDPFASTHIRVIGALICFLVYQTIRRDHSALSRALQNKRAVTYTAIGSFIGPFIGVSLSLLSLHYLETGIAATILSLVPVCIIPFALFLHKEYVSFRAVIGACIAVSGIFLLSNF
ncbi:MAG: EamA family transporter [Desulfobulbaceae bacterium]|nr:MAG: EamA family transporter [Desulfobulbaceae bacterium]